MKLIPEEKVVQVDALPLLRSVRVTCRSGLQRTQNHPSLSTRRGEYEMWHYGGHMGGGMWLGWLIFLAMVGFASG